MAIILMIIGGAAGGFLGWLLDRKRAQSQASNPQPEEACEVRT